MKHLALAPWRGIGALFKRSGVAWDHKLPPRQTKPHEMYFRNTSKDATQDRKDLVIYVHGKDESNQGSSDHFQQLRDTLGIPVTVQEYHGTGKSHKTDSDMFSDYSIKEHAKTLATSIHEALERNNGTITVMGYSIGSAISLWALKILQEEDTDLSRINFVSLNGFGDLDRYAYIANAKAMHATLVEADIMPEQSLAALFRDLPCSSFAFRTDDDATIARHAALIQQLIDEDPESSLVTRIMDMVPLDNLRTETTQHGSTLENVRLPGTEIPLPNLLKALIHSNSSQRLVALRQEIHDKTYKLDYLATLYQYRHITLCKIIMEKLENGLDREKALALLHDKRFQQYELGNPRSELCKVLRNVQDMCYSYLKLDEMVKVAIGEKTTLTHQDLHRERLYISKLGRYAMGRWSIGLLKQSASAGLIVGSAIASLTIGLVLWAPLFALGHFLKAVGAEKFGNGIIQIGEFFLEATKTLIGGTLALVGAAIGGVVGFIAGIGKSLIDWVSKTHSAKPLCSEVEARMQLLQCEQAQQPHQPSNSHGKLAQLLGVKKPSQQPEIIVRDGCEYQALSDNDHSPRLSFSDTPAEADDTIATAPSAATTDDSAPKPRGG